MFKQDTNSVFVVRTSKHIDLDLHERERFKYSRVQYQCTHFGTPRVRARCKDLWKIKTLITRMPGLICFEIQFPRKRLEIKKPVWATTILQRPTYNAWNNCTEIRGQKTPNLNGKVWRKLWNLIQKMTIFCAWSMQNSTSHSLWQK